MFDLALESSLTFWFSSRYKFTFHFTTSHWKQMKTLFFPFFGLLTIPSPPCRLCGYATCAENNKKSSPNRGNGSIAQGRVKCGAFLREGHRGKRPNCRTRLCTPTRESQVTWDHLQTEADLTAGFYPDRRRLTTIQGYGTLDLVTHPLTGTFMKTKLLSCSEAWLCIYTVVV